MVRILYVCTYMYVLYVYACILYVSKYMYLRNTYIYVHICAIPTFTDIHAKRYIYLHILQHTSTYIYVHIGTSVPIHSLHTDTCRYIRYVHVLTRHTDTIIYIRSKYLTNQIRTYTYIYCHLHTHTYEYDLWRIRTYYWQIYLQIRANTCNMNIQKWICTFGSLMKVYVFCTYFVVFCTYFVNIL